MPVPRPTRYVAVTDAITPDHAYGATMSENAAGRHLAVGAGAPADPDHLANGLTGAVTDFVEDLVEDLDTPSDSDDE